MALAAATAAALKLQTGGDTTALEHGYADGVLFVDCSAARLSLRLLTRRDADVARSGRPART